MKTGFAQTEITPPLGIYLCGQLEPMKADGIESRLFSRAMCLDDGEICVIICSNDILAISNDFAAEVCSRAGALCGIPADNIIVTATHTHSGPNTVDIFGKDANSDYVSQLKSNIVDTIKTAFENRSNGMLKFASGELDGFAFNRRFIMSDGTIQTHPLKGDPHMVQPEGPDSKQVDVLCVYDDAGNIKGASVTFGCHATVMERDNTKISSDYAGKLCEYLGKKLGCDNAVQFLAGAAGNICQVNPRDISQTEVGLSWCERMGKAIGDKANGLLQNAKAGQGTLKIISKTIKLKRREIPAELVQWANNHSEIPTEVPQLSDYGSELYGKLPDQKVSLDELFKTTFWANFYANEIKTLDRMRVENAEMPFTIKIVSQANWAMVFLPCELFVEWSNFIRKESPFEFTSVVTLANGWNGYIPTKRSFERSGGYETKEVTSTMLRPEAGDVVTKEIIGILKAEHKS